MRVQAGWLRTTIIIGIVVASFLATLAVAYEMAVARVPRQRAAFESLVRAQTGLDIRFNELRFASGGTGPRRCSGASSSGNPGDRMCCCARRSSSSESMRGRRCERGGSSRAASR